MNVSRAWSAMRIQTMSEEGGKRMKLKIGNFLMIGVVFLSLIFLAGCGTLETLVKKDGSSTPLADWIGANEGKETAKSATGALGEGISVALYYPDITGKHLLKEERMLPKTESMARETVRQWLKGPKETERMQNPVSPVTTLRDIAIKENNLVIVDLSREFLQPNSKVSSETVLYGLVNTLTQFSTIKQVQIRVDGSPITRYGTVSALNLTYNDSLMNNSSDNIPSQSIKKESKGTESVLPEEKHNNSNGALPDSPSSINLFSYPPSTT